MPKALHRDIALKMEKGVMMKLSWTRNSLKF